MVFLEVRLSALTVNCLHRRTRFATHLVALRRLTGVQTNRFNPLYNQWRNAYKQVERPDDYKPVSRPIADPPSLAEHLRDRIRLGGPMTVADYMRAALTHPRKGYYSQGDVFGASGDFTTSPEISPLFGEMVGVWFNHELRKIGAPRPLQLVELGPGRGTLTADLIRIFKKLPPGDDQISIHLVETSDRLAQAQARLLGVSELHHTGENSPHYQHGISANGRQVFWYRHIDRVPHAFSIFVAHEFFDALPIHKLQKIDNTWREVKITLKNPEDENPEFQFTVSRSGSPPASLLLDADETRERVEVCLEAAEIVRHIAHRLDDDGGISLIIDYGHEGTKSDTFRGFKSHKLQDPLVNPGTGDLTADVDFRFLKRAAGDQVVTCGPLCQGDFLKNMGIDARLQKLCSALPDQAETLTSGAKMITEDMGQRFKFLALFPAVLKEHLTKHPVAGFNSIPLSNSNR